jgi:putative transposase
MINTREIAEEYRLSHWAGIMQERNAKGMSIRAYCESMGMHENVYYYWQRKLREATATPASVNGEVNVPSGWVVCERRVANPEQNAIEIEIGKSRIVVRTDTDHELLSKVCRTLMTLC